MPDITMCSGHFHDARRIEVMDYKEFLRQKRAEWDALPWHVKRWRRLRSRLVEFRWRIGEAWRVLRYGD